MGLKLFADHCVPFSIIQSLREAGVEALVLKDHIPPDSSERNNKASTAGSPPLDELVWSVPITK